MAPIQTNLNVSPYWDDYDEKKDYYKVLFKPSVSVQMRELNQLQTILQRQIERFGDNIFVKGTIVSGCNFQFYTPYPYVKLPDAQLEGTPVAPALYLGKFLEDPSTGLRAFVVDFAEGYELSAPNLKTLYVNYINSGDTGLLSGFTPGSQLTIEDASHPVHSIDINNGGSGFSNSDQLVFSPCLVVNVATGTFSESDILYNPLTRANVEITAVDTVSQVGKTILSVKPRPEDLTNSSVNSAAWEFFTNDVVRNSGSATGTIENVIGKNAQGRIITNAIGAVTQAPLLNGGRDFTSVPTVVVKTANATAGVALLNLVAKNFIAKVKVPSDADSVGNGYAFGVSEGIVYQQGHFLRIEPQTIIISKYDTQPNNLCVGLNTVGAIVDATEDETLYENALGVNNEKAPGADGLRLTPELVLLTKEQAFANTSFFSFVQWNDGSPAIQNQLSAYSRIGDFIAQDIYDSSGNFVLDAFQVTTQAVANNEKEGTLYTAVIDPGQGYINGKKVQTLSNYKIDMQKALDTKTSNNTVSLNYGNFVRVNNLAGQFDFSSGATVALYSRPALFLSNTSALTTGTITPQGANIGTAKIRSLEIESGYPGTVSAVHKMYLFDITMNPGQNFKEVKGIFWDGAYDGIADVIQTFDATTSANVTQIYEPEDNALLFDAGVESLKGTSNSNYIYRTTAVVNTVIDTAHITVTLSDPNEFFAWEGDLSSTEMGEVIVVPVEAAIKCANLTGTVAGNTTNNRVTGTTTDFTSAYAVGDYVEITNGSTNTAIKRVTGVINATSMQVDSFFQFTDAGLAHRRIFPKNVPIPVGQRPGLAANVDGTGKVLTVYFKHSNTAQMNLFFVDNSLETQVSYDVSRQGISSATKTANRNKYVKICIANSVGQAHGPWCVGVPDAFRLRAVCIGNSSVNADSTDITSHFYIDHNQNANYMGLSYLMLRPRTNLSIVSTDYLLVCFDYFTRDNEGYFDTASYLRTTNTANIAVQDSLQFNNLSLSSGASSWEVPEVNTPDGTYYDLYKTLDFRPTAANTVAITSSPLTAPINPPETVVLSAHSKFPKPNAVMHSQVEQYLGRIDDVYIGQTGQIFLLKGIPDVNPRNRYQSNHPKDSLRLQTLVVPPYPDLAATINQNIRAIINTGMGNELFTTRRVSAHTITPFFNTTNLQTSQPMVYTMEDIATLERRIADLEYYVALSLMETNITNRIIPSSVNPALDRFKFGFFADDFSTYLYCDLANPQYAASIEVEGSGDILSGTIGNPLSGNSMSQNYTNAVAGTIGQPSLKTTYRLVPPKRVWQLKHFTENIYYIDQEIIKQDNATEKPNPCVVTIANVVISNIGGTTGGTGGTGTVGNTTTTTVQYSYYLQVNRAQSTVYINSSTGLANIYFDIRAGATKGFGGKITVYDDKNAIVASTDWVNGSQKQLGPNDIFFLSTNPVANDFNQAISKQSYRMFERLQGALQDYGSGAGKIPLKIPLSGGRFLIRTEVSNNAVMDDPSWKMLVEFPEVYTTPVTTTAGNTAGGAASNGQATVVSYTTINSPDCSPLPPSYQGSLEAGSLTLVTWACSNIFRTNAAGYKAFVLIGTGLKANTIHTLYVDTVPWTYVIPMMEGGGGGTGVDAAAQIASHSVNGIWNFGTYAVNSDQGDALEFFANIDNVKLKTNRSGQIVCLVFFPLQVAGWFSQDFNATAYNFDAAYSADGSNYNGDPALANRLISHELLTPTYGSSGYTTIVLQDTTGASQAVRVFANRTPNKTIPSDPRGWI